MALALHLLDFFNLNEKKLLLLSGQREIWQSLDENSGVLQLV